MGRFDGKSNLFRAGWYHCPEMDGDSRLRTAALVLTGVSD